MTGRGLLRPGPSATQIEIASAADDRYIPHLAAMLDSVRLHESSRPIRINYLCDSVSPAAAGRRKLEEFAASRSIVLRWVQVPDELMKGLPSRDYLSHAVWFRLFMPRLLDDLSKVLYIDADVIAMQSIGPLWDTELDGMLFAAVPNVVPAHYKDRARSLGLPEPACYFNAGVALWNLHQMRLESFEQNVLRYAREHLPNLIWLEQDALNALYYNRWQAVHPRWNCQNGIIFGAWGTRLLAEMEVEEAINQPGLLHFEGGSCAKPWHLLSEHPHRKLYWFHRRRTPWPRALPEGINLTNLAKWLIPNSVLKLIQPVVRSLRRRLRSIAVSTKTNQS